jgi:5-methylcytosine-specific restriction enzyme subunit McrC
MDTPLHEWLYSQFLQMLSHLVARGLRFDYERIEEESRFIRGQLNVPAQQRQPPGRANVFHIRHDIYSPNRVENRLLKSALEIVYRHCRHPENWRLANELVHMLEPIEALRDPVRYLHQWANNKLLQAYQPVKPWCQVILEQLNPNFQRGRHRGITLMFPMEKLFESHVAACLRAQIARPWKLKEQASSEFLVSHQTQGSPAGQDWFNLQPDILLYREGARQVLDTKWKLLDMHSGNSKDKYGLSQQDFYQLFAYGHKYQAGVGDMMLIYPRHSRFTDSLPCFHFDEHLRLWVVPFCIEQDRLIRGEWGPAFEVLDAAALSPAGENSNSVLAAAGLPRDRQATG